MKQHVQSMLPGSHNIARYELENGICVLVYENHISPTAVVSGYLRIGSQDDSPEKRGLASYTVDAMERGTRTRSFSQLYEEIESIGASFGLNAGTHTTSFGAKSLSENLDLMLDIIRDVLCFPAFEPEQVEKVRTDLLTAIRERSFDTQRMASLQFYELAYPEKHPYHWSQLGYHDTISAIGHADLVAFHQTHVAPEDMVLAIVGNVNTREVLTAVERMFSQWENTPVKRDKIPVVPRLDAKCAKSIQMDDKIQTNVILGWPGPERKHPDFLPCFLANTVMGVFGMYGRLGRRVREENSLAYFAYSSISGGLGPGPWRINTGVDPDNIDKALEIIQAEVRRLLEEPIPEDELDDTKAFLTGSLPLHLETNEGLAQSLINIERHHLGLDYLMQYKKMIMEISSSDILNAVQNWMHPEHYALSVAGPSQYEVS